MLNSRSRSTQQPNFDLSKFWAFRLINLLFVVSIFLILSFLIIPIPYFQKIRSPTVIALDLNHSSYSHAIKISSRKLPDNIISVSFTTHNSDHIIGSTTFGDTTVDRDSNSISRFINCHYHDRRKGLPFRVLIVDVYSSVFVFRKYLSSGYDNQLFKQIDGWVYTIPAESVEFKNVSIQSLMASKPPYVYKSQYTDMDGKVITHYIPDQFTMFGTIKAGSKNLDLEKFPLYRTITTIYHIPTDTYKIIIASVYRDNPNPIYKELFKHAKEDKFYESFQNFVKELMLTVTYQNYLIHRFEGAKLDPVGFRFDQHKADGLVIFDYKVDGHKYEIVFGDHKEDYVNPYLGRSFEQELDLRPYTLDRIILLSYPPKQPIPPSYHIFDRMSLHTVYKFRNHSS